MMNKSSLIVLIFYLAATLGLTGAIGVAAAQQEVSSRRGGRRRDGIVYGGTGGERPR